MCIISNLNLYGVAIPFFFMEHTPKDSGDSNDIGGDWHNGSDPVVTYTNDSYIT